MIIQTGRPLKLYLRRDLERSLRQGHPWIFIDALKDAPTGAPGQVALLFDKRGNPLCLGYSDPESPLSFRACTMGKGARLDDDWALRGFERAASLRERLFGKSPTTGYRLFNGEGDGLPGLVVDRYGDAACVRLDGPAAEAFWRKGEGVGQWLKDALGLEVVYGRARARGGAVGWPIIGETPQAPVPFVEGACRFTADVVKGQKTGFFLDQRENRRAISEIAQGLRVLNVFSYSGGFSIAAGVGGATGVTSVDIAPRAIADAERHWALNDLPEGAHEGVAGDAFAFLEETKERWDVVILDPPSFAPNKDSAPQAIKAYERLIMLGARVTNPGGYLGAASCSSHVSAGDFQGAALKGIGRARRQGQLLRDGGQGPDHPVPGALPEMRYLKFLLYRLS